jgi:hypothetical protein
MQVYALVRGGGRHNNTPLTLEALVSLSLFFCVILRQKYHKGLTKAPSPSELRMSLRNKWHLDTSF